MTTKKFSEILAEEMMLEVKVGRAWSGKLEKIDKLFMWMYEKGILSKGEKSKKDKLFHKYYRWYNDGDFPSGLKNSDGNTLYKQPKEFVPGKSWKDYSPFFKMNVEEILEYNLEDFIKNVLKKYWSKIDRKEFSIDTSIKAIKELLEMVEKEWVGGLSYWSKNTNDPEVKSRIANITSISKDLQNEISKVDPELGRKVVEYAHDELVKTKKWTSSMESKWKEIKKELVEIKFLLDNILASLEKMKALRVLSK